jgi:uncharacterized coiled-coil protein SlyX
MSTSNAGDQQSDRVTNLELLFTHLERQIAELSSVVLEQGQRIERLERELRRQREARETNVEPADEEGDEWPEDE